MSKLAGEHYLDFFARVHGMQTITLRYANVYGPRQDPHGEAGVVAIFSKKLLASQSVTIFGDGLQTRDYVYVGDVVRANVACLDTDFCGSVNIGTAIETTVVELYDHLREITGATAEAVHAEERSGEVRRISIDNARAREVLGWEPVTDLKTGLARTVDFFRARS